MDYLCHNQLGDDEHLPVEKQRRITLAELLDPEFFFEERQITMVYKDQSSLQSESV